MQQTFLIISIIINIVLGIIVSQLFDKLKYTKLDYQDKIDELEQQKKQELEKAQQQAEKENKELGRENSKLDRARLLAEQAEGRIKQEMLDIQQKIQIVLTKLLEKNKSCRESHYKTIQALQSKFVKAADLQIMRKKLSEKNRKKLLNHFEKLKKEIDTEISESEITQQTIEKAFKEIETRIEQAVNNKAL
uniref:Uncharacterized protein n=1 Tax=Desulfurella acetivorans TaxID=33002 RepID=A0A832AVD8_DESAE